MGLTSEEGHAEYAAQYPGGWELEFVLEPERHAGYKEAVGAAITTALQSEWNESVPTLTEPPAVSTPAEDAVVPAATVTPTEQPEGVVVEDAVVPAAVLTESLESASVEAPTPAEIDQPVEVVDVFDVPKPEEKS